MREWNKKVIPMKHQRKNQTADEEENSEDEYENKRYDALQIDNQEETDSQAESEVFGLDSEQSEVDSDDYDNETLHMSKLSKQLLPQLNESDASEEEEEMEDTTWGQSRKSFYSAEEVAVDDEQVALEEQQEALRLQQIQSNAINKEDYFDDDSFETLLMNRSMRDGNETIATTFSGKEGVTEKEIKNLLSLQMNEIPTLVEVFQNYYLELMNLHTLPPTLVLLTRKRLLQMYLMNVAFYFYYRVEAKLNGNTKSEKQHPVIDVLSVLRDMLDAVDHIENDGDSSMSEDISDVSEIEEDVSDASELSEIQHTVSAESVIQQEDTSQSESSDSHHEIETQAKPLIINAKAPLPLLTVLPKKRRTQNNLLDISHTSTDTTDAFQKQKALKFHLKRVDNSLQSRANRNKFGGDDDVPIKRKRVELPPTSTVIDDGFGEEHYISAEEENEEMDEYEALKASRAQKKQRQKESHIPQTTPLYDTIETYDGDKRPADYKIMTNKGLTPHRPKIDRNPRVKRRVKYETAMRKLKDFRRVVGKGGEKKYAGEKSGIKVKLARSVKL